MKLKHNKKRNTAFLYESLIKELAKAVMKNDKERKNTIVSIIKEYFSKGTVLGTELGLYKTLKETQQLDLYTAERLVAELKKEYSALDKEKVFICQSDLIETINKKIGKRVFANFVPNYKTLATISQVFSNTLPAKEKVLLERNLLGRLVAKPTSAPAKKGMEHIDNLVFKKVIENFNQKYNGRLLEEQQELLNKYILSFDDTSVEFKVHLNEEMGRIKGCLVDLKEKEEIKLDKEMSEKLDRVNDLISRFQTRKIDSDMIEKVMSIQSLVSECYN